MEYKMGEVILNKEEACKRLGISMEAMDQFSETLKAIVVILESVVNWKGIPNIDAARAVAINLALSAARETIRVYGGSDLDVARALNLFIGACLDDFSRGAKSPPGEETVADETIIEFLKSAGMRVKDEDGTSTGKDRDVN